jgi:hypothetical protein
MPSLSSLLPAKGNTAENYNLERSSFRERIKLCEFFAEEGAESEPWPVRRTTKLFLDSKCDPDHSAVLAIPVREGVLLS